jgi:hypothetical protein
VLGEGSLPLSLFSLASASLVLHALLVIECPFKFNNRWCDDVRSNTLRFLEQLEFKSAHKNTLATVRAALATPPHRMFPSLVSRRFSVRAATNIKPKIPYT